MAGFAVLAGFPPVHLDAETAAVDLRGARQDQVMLQAVTALFGHHETFGDID